MFLQEAAQQAAADVMMNPGLTQLAGSSVIVWIIDLLKRANWFPWMSADTSAINRTAAIVGAAITAAGIHFAMEPVAIDGTYTLTITGLSFASFFHFLEAFTVSIASQQTILKVYQITNLLRRIAGGTNG